MSHSLHLLGHSQQGYVDNKPQSILFQTGSIVKLSNGRLLLINCSESSQMQVIQHGSMCSQGGGGISFNRIDAILITSLEWSHISGLPGMLAMLLYKKQEENPHVTVVGPKGIRNYCKTVFELTDTFFRKIGMTFVELTEDDVADDDGDRCSSPPVVLYSQSLQRDKRWLSVRVVAHRLGGEMNKNNNNICCSYLIDSSCQSGLDEQKLKQYDVTDSELKRKLSSKLNVVSSDGLTIDYDMVKAKARLDSLLIVPAPRISMEECERVIGVTNRLLSEFVNAQKMNYALTFLIEDAVRRVHYDAEKRIHEFQCLQSNMIPCLTNHAALNRQPWLIIRVRYSPSSVGLTEGTVRLNQVDRVPLHDTAISDINRTKRRPCPQSATPQTSHTIILNI